MAATIKDIALECSLATATVSAYLNGQKVRRENAEAIERAIKKLGYIRNDYARGLKLHRSSTVGVIIYDLSDRFGTSVICSIEEHLSRYGYGILVCDYKTSGRTFDETVRFLMSKMIDGLILVMTEPDDVSSLDVCLNAGLPVVSVDRLIDRDDVTQIVIDNFTSVNEATKTLLEKGHKSIALVCGDRNAYTHSERHRGYKQALDEAGEYREENVFDSNMTVADAITATVKCLENTDVTAIVATSYHMTVGVMLALGSLEKRRQIDIVGFDTRSLKCASTSRLISINQPTEKMGETAAGVIMKAIGNISAIDSSTLGSSTLDFSQFTVHGSTDGRIITLNAKIEI